MYQRDLNVKTYKEYTLTEMTQRFVFDDLKKATAAEKAADKFNLRADSQAQDGYFYVAVTGKYTDIEKWMKSI